MSKKSDHLLSAPKGTKPCGVCKGSGWDPKRGAPHACPNCHGWGY